jgi:hypothetical protein
MDKKIPNIISISENPENIDSYDPFKPRYYVYLKEPLVYQSDFDKLYTTVQKNKEESKTRQIEVKKSEVGIDGVLQEYFDFLYTLLTSGISFVFENNDSQQNNYLYFGITLGLVSLLLFSLGNYKQQ